VHTKRPVEPRTDSCRSCLIAVGNRGRSAARSVASVHPQVSVRQSATLDLRRPGNPRRPIHPAHRRATADVSLPFERVWASLDLGLRTASGEDEDLAISGHIVPFCATPGTAPRSVSLLRMSFRRHGIGPTSGLSGHERFGCALTGLGCPPMTSSQCVVQGGSVSARFSSPVDGWAAKSEVDSRLSGNLVWNIGSVAMHPDEVVGEDRVRDYVPDGGHMTSDAAFGRIHRACRSPRWPAKTCPLRPRWRTV
jgi:hypothetical protein